MDRQTMVVAVMGQVISAAIVLTLIRVWYNSRTQKLRQGPSDDALRHLSAQIEQLQGSMDAVSIEVERISEGQRFTTKLLSERGEKVPGAL